MHARLGVTKLIANFPHNFDISLCKLKMEAFHNSSYFISIWQYLKKVEIVKTNIQFTHWKSKWGEPSNCYSERFFHSFFAYGIFPKFLGSSKRAFHGDVCFEILLNAAALWWVWVVLCSVWVCLVVGGEAQLSLGLGCWCVDHPSSHPSSCIQGWSADGPWVR